MKTISSPLELQGLCVSLKQSGRSIGFVPTMGALHSGHLELVREARKNSDFVVVSIFVNPTQFNNLDDYNKYPITFSADQALLEQESVDVLFAPTADLIYADQKRFSVTEKNHVLELCGKTRPGHFNGVLTVVLKLLQITQPTQVFMGEKDFQQLHLIEEMVSAFFIPTKIVSCPTVRDEKGLALSSRNARLSPEGLEKAQVFAQALKTETDLSTLETYLQLHGIQVDYLEEKYGRRFAAVFIDDVRLIDNVSI
jgi:pantoate--beta-alanine ligase